MAGIQKALRVGLGQFLQFAINTSKPPAPVALQGPGTALPVRKAARVQAVTCLAQLALPHQAGNTQGEAVTALNLHSPAATGHPSIQPGSTCTPERRGRPCPRWRPARSAWSTFAAAIRCTARGSPPLFRMQNKNKDPPLPPPNS